MVSDDELVQNMQSIRPHQLGDADIPPTSQSRDALLKEIMMSEETEPSGTKPAWVMPRRFAVRASAAVASIAVCAGGLFVFSQHGDDTVTANSPSSTEPQQTVEPNADKTEVPTDSDDASLCGTSLPEHVEIFGERDQSKVTTTQHVDDDGFLQFESTYDGATIFVTWPSIEREEFSSAEEWEQPDGPLLVGTSPITADGDPPPLNENSSIVEVEILWTEDGLDGLADGALPDPEPSKQPSYKSIVVKPGDGFVDEGCQTVSIAVEYEGIKAAPSGFSFAGTTSESVEYDFIDLSPFIVESFDVAELPAEISPCDGGNPSTSQDIVSSFSETPRKALETFIASDEGSKYWKSGYYEMKVSEDLIAYGIPNGHDPEGTAPQDVVEFLQVLTVERQPDGWTATSAQSTGC